MSWLKDTRKLLYSDLFNITTMLKFALMLTQDKTFSIFCLTSFAIKGLLPYFHAQSMKQDDLLMFFRYLKYKQCRKKQAKFVMLNIQLSIDLLC